MKHYLVTGGAGFIGSNLISTLFRQNPDIRITCIDNFDPFYSREIKEQNIREFKKNPGFRLLQNDLAFTTAAEWMSLIKEPVDMIIHLAAKAGVRPSIDNPLAYQQTNIIGLQHLLEFTRLKKIKQFIFSSSSSVYGINDHFPWMEDEKAMPVSPYAMTKLSGEMLGQMYSKLYGIRFIALRFFTVYGPAQRPDLVIHKFTRSMMKREPVTFYGNGLTSRDYTYVDDAIHGLTSAIKYDLSDFEIINLGNNYSVTLNDLLVALEEVTGLTAQKKIIPAQPGDVPKTFADISKACRLLGYHPQTTLKEGLTNFYSWFCNNQELLLP